jgi:predicted GIY-YIG superfamily endonuclease
MFRDNYGREWQGPLPFTSEGIDLLEEKSHMKSGLYQILCKSQLAYIGVSSVSVFDRLRSHLKGTGNKRVARRRSSDFYEFACWFCDGKTARQIESHVLVEEKPGFNQKTEYKNYILNITVH